MSGGEKIALNLSLQRDRFRFEANIDLPLNGVTGVYGPSGAGKTTLLRCIAGLEPGATGTLHIGDACWQQDRVFVPAHERNVGYVFQEPRLFSHLTVRGNMEYGWRRRGSTADIQETAALLGIDHLLDRRPDGLSGGEAQRVSIARALSSSPRLLLMDEPLASIDVGRRDEILPYLDRIQAETNTPVLYVSHSLDEICRLCDQLIVFEDGRTTVTGALQDVLLESASSVLSGQAASAVLNARIVGYDAEYELTTAEFSGGQLILPGKVAKPGRSIRLRVRANDISLCRETEAETTILNRLAVEVESIQDTGNASVLVRLRAGEDHLLARVTRRSIETLALASGQTVIAQLKAVAVREP